MAQLPRNGDRGDTHELLGPFSLHRKPFVTIAEALRRIDDEFTSFNDVYPADFAMVGETESFTRPILFFHFVLGYDVFKFKRIKASAKEFTDPAHFLPIAFKNSGEDKREEIEQALTDVTDEEIPAEAQIKQECIRVLQALHDEKTSIDELDSQSQVDFLVAVFQLMSLYELPFEFVAARVHEALVGDSALRDHVRKKRCLIVHFQNDNKDPHDIQIRYGTNYSKKTAVLSQVNDPAVLAQYSTHPFYRWVQLIQNHASRGYPKWIVHIPVSDDAPSLTYPPRGYVSVPCMSLEIAKNVARRVASDEFSPLLHDLMLAYREGVIDFLVDAFDARLEPLDAALRYWDKHLRWLHDWSTTDKNLRSPGTVFEIDDGGGCLLSVEHLLNTRRWLTHSLIERQDAQNLSKSLENRVLALAEYRPLIQEGSLNDEDRRRNQLRARNAVQDAVNFLDALLRKWRLVDAERWKFVEQDFHDQVHDLKGPAGVVLGAAEIVRDRINPDRATEMIHRIHRNSDRLIKMIERILHSGKDAHEIERRQFNLSEVLQDLTDTYGSRTGKLQVTVSCDAPERLEVFADELALYAAIENLVKNAKEEFEKSLQQDTSDSPAKNIWIRARVVCDPSGVDGVEIAVEDNGRGVAQEVRPKLFRPGATHGKAKGTGRGLHNVKKTIEAHGGTIAYEDRAEGGACFKMWLPVQAYSPPL